LPRYEQRPRPGLQSDTNVNTEVWHELLVVVLDGTDDLAHQSIPARPHVLRYPLGVPLPDPVRLGAPRDFDYKTFPNCRQFGLVDECANLHGAEVCYLCQCGPGLDSVANTHWQGVHGPLDRGADVGRPDLRIEQAHSLARPLDCEASRVSICSAPWLEPLLFSCEGVTCGERSGQRKLSPIQFVPVRRLFRHQPLGRISGALQLQDFRLGLAEVARHLSPLATLRPRFEHASRVLRLYELLACSREICTLGGDLKRQQRITAPHLPPLDAL